METERVVVITGATGGLGTIVAHHFGAAGDRLALVGTNQVRLEQLVSELTLPVGRVISTIADLVHPDGARKVYQEVIGHYGRVDILLHLIGGWSGGKPVSEVTGEEISGMLDQHVWTTFHMLKAFLPEMQKHGWGRVVAISSPVAGNPPANRLPYSVGKAGEEAIVLTAAAELRNSGVTANILRVQTIDLQHARDNAPSDKNASWTTPEEILSAIEYLCSDDGGAVNGVRIPLYGSP